jgi:hypothetical protein
MSCIIYCNEVPLTCLFEPEEPQFPGIFELYSDAITCETAKAESLCDPGSPSTPLAWNHASPELSSEFQQAGRCLTESDTITDPSEEDEASSSCFPPAPGSKQHPKHGNRNFAFRNPRLTYELHPLVNGECLLDWGI